MKTKKNCIIVTSSLKGGVGKTSLCATSAMYFLLHGIPTVVIDADLQQSLSRHRKRDLEAHPSAETPWPCIFLNTTDIEGVRSTMERIKKQPYCFLIDCPGNINDPALKIIFEEADIAVVPFELNADSVDATVIFGELFRKYFTAKIFFIPNKVSASFLKRGEVRKAREMAMELLGGKLGVVTPDIKLSTHMNGYSTLELIEYEKRKIVRDALKPIMKPIWKLYNH